MAGMKNTFWSIVHVIFLFVQFWFFCSFSVYMFCTSFAVDLFCCTSFPFASSIHLLPFAGTRYTLPLHFCCSFVVVTDIMRLICTLLTTHALRVLVILPLPLRYSIQLVGRCPLVLRACIPGCS